MSNRAREALRCCANIHQVHLPVALPKNEDGAPERVGAYYWSISHKNKYVVAVLSKTPVGIDLEELVQCKVDVHRKLANDDEWDRLGDRSLVPFYRLWTAKEAVVKAMGQGIGSFLDCEFMSSDTHTMRLDFAGLRWTVEHYQHDGHIFAITRQADNINWNLGCGRTD